MQDRVIFPRKSGLTLGQQMRLHPGDTSLEIRKSQENIDVNNRAEL